MEVGFRTVVSRSGFESFINLHTKRVYVQQMVFSQPLQVSQQYKTERIVEHKVVIVSYKRTGSRD